MIFLSIVLAGCFLFLSGVGQENHANAAQSPLKLDDIKEHFDGQRAFDYLRQICEIGPRPSGSPGMTRQQQLLTEHFEKLGAEVRLQKFTGRDPRDGRPVPMANLIVHWLPKKKDRIVLCAHYDTLPFPMLDRRNPRGVFIGANDGGSGVALLMELGNQMSNLNLKYGVDFVFFDAEEYIFLERHPFFQGSEHFAREHRDQPRDYQYHWGVLIDMIGDKQLRIYQERNSMRWPETRPLVEDIWATARRLGVREFIPQRGAEIRDDHLSLRDIAGIPTCVIIDFDYPDRGHRYWHTTADTLDKCSPLSLAKVGWVVRAWLETAR